MNLRELDVAPHPVTWSPNSGMSDFVFRQAGWMFSENSTVLSNSISAMSWYTVAEEYSGCCIHFFTWYFCARKPGSLRFTAPSSTWTGGLLMDITDTFVRNITGLCWLNTYEYVLTWWWFIHHALSYVILQKHNTVHSVNLNLKLRHPRCVTLSTRSHWMIWAMCILHCIVSSETQFETWWWPSARAETCSLSNKYSTTLLVVFCLYYLHHLSTRCIIDRGGFTMKFMKHEFQGPSLAQGPLINIKFHT